MLTREFLEEHYVKLDKTAADIKREFGVSTQEVWYWLKKYEIKAKPRGGSRQTIDISDRKIGSLTILKQIDGDGHSAVWQALCDCGNICSIKSWRVRSGNKNSCGKCHIRYIGKWKGIGEMSGWYFNTIKRGAEKRDFEFNISKEYIWNLFLQQNKKCALTGIDIFFVKNITGNKISRKSQTASLDRIDSSIGYIEGNVQWVHKDINFMKQSLTQEEFIQLCNQVAKTHPR